MAERTGLEPATPGVTILTSYQTLNLAHKERSAFKTMSQLA